MNKKLAVLSLFAAIAITANACDTGSHNDLQCEADNYTSECLTDSRYMVCENNTLVVKSCGETAYCKADDNGLISCVPLFPVECDEITPCTDPKAACTNGKCIIPPECTEENAAEKCPAEKPVCKAGVCTEKEPECTEENAAEKCPAGKPICKEGICTEKEPECTEENAALNCPAIRPVCVNGVCTAVEPECTEENAAEVCTDPEKSACINGICAAPVSEPECTEENAAEVCTDPEKSACINGVCSAPVSEPECTIENEMDVCTDPEKPVCINGVCAAYVPECTEENAAQVCPSHKPLCKEGVCTPECTIDTVEEDCTDPEKPVCSAGICVAKPAEKECVTNDQCTTEEKPVCNSDGKCVAKPEVEEKCGSLPACTGDNYCLNGECHPKSDIDGKECSEISFTSCTNNAKVSCENMFDSTYYHIEDCGNDKICALDNDGFAFCAKPCSEDDANAGKTLTTCDPNSDYDVSEGTYAGEITYKCTQVGDKYFMTVFSSKLCSGFENCMIITGTNDHCSL